MPTPHAELQDMLSPERSRRDFLRAGGSVVLVGSGLSGLLVACGGSPDDTASPAKVSRAAVAGATGTTGVLTFSFYEAPALNSGKVQAKYSTISSADEILAKVRSRANRLQVINSGANIMSEIYAVDAVQPIPVAALPNYSEIEPTLRDNPIFSKDGQIYAVPFAVSPGLLAWDSAKVPEPKTADDLLMPVYRDKIGLYNDAEMILMVHRLLGGSLTKVTSTDAKSAVDYLDKLKPNIKTIYEFGQEVDLFGRGDIAVATQTFASLVISARKARASVKANLLGSFSFVDSWSIAEGAKLPEALSWINHSLSPAGQKALQEASGGYPSVPTGTNTALLPDELRKLTLADLLKSAPVNQGVPVSGDGLATRTTIQTAWNDFKAGL